MQAHQNKSHRPSRWAPTNTEDPSPDQQTLIQESQDSVARKTAQAAFESHVQIEHSSSESDETPDEEEYSITIRNGRIYINDELVLGSPEPGVVDSPATGSSSKTHTPIHCSERMAIGYVLQLQTRDCTMSDADDDHEYPEAFALDDDELPRRTHTSTFTHAADQFADPEQGIRIFRWVLFLLKLNQWISVSELKDLWMTLLTSEHRILILQQLHNININEVESKILSVLHGTVLSELINAWAQFKLLPFQIFPESFPYASSAKETIYAVLKYCTTLEALMDEGRKTAVDQGYSIPDLVRRPPLDANSISMDTPFVNLIESLAERVKCRMVHQRWVQFTNVMILREIGPYIKDLKMVVRAMYPEHLHGGAWYRNYGLS